MSFAIYGLGTAAPRHRVEQADAARMAAQFCGGDESQQRLLPALYRRSGVKTRHSVLLESSTNHRPAQQSFFPQAADADDRGPSTAARMQAYRNHAAALAMPAAQQALANSTIAADAISHLITVSCSGFTAPGIDVTLIEELALPRDVARTHIGFMGCHAAINGLRVAHAIARAEPAARVLLVAIELCSLHQQYGWQPDRLVSNSLFADGAAAIVGGAPSAGPEVKPWRVTATGSTLIADTRELMSWQIADHGFEMSLSPTIPDVILSQLAPWLSQWLARRGLSMADIGCWAVHPGGPRILAACGTSLGLESRDLDDSFHVLAEYGNMSSPTVLFILRRLREQQRSLPCVVLGFGPGLAIEAALIE